jgi:hypothetical protein
MRCRLAWLVVVAGASGAVAQSPPASPPPAGDRERERFLLEGVISSVASAPGGTLRAMLKRGGLLHEAGIQVIEETSPRPDRSTTVETDLHDSYRNDVAAYRLDRLLGLGMVPVTVAREHDRRTSAFIWGVDDRLMTEKDRYVARVRPPDVASWNRQLSSVAVFDQLIFNFDRKAGNLVIDRGWRVWMIDHRRAFKLARHLGNPRLLGDSCERDLLAALRTLRAPALKAEMKDLLSDGQVEGLLARRDAIVAYYDRMIADRGEAAVLFDLPPRVGGLP